MANVPLKAIGRFNLSVTERKTAGGKTGGGGGRTGPLPGRLRQEDFEVVSFAPLPAVYLRVGSFIEINGNGGKKSLSR